MNLKKHFGPQEVLLVDSGAFSSVFVLPVCAGLRSRKWKETWGSDEENTLSWAVGGGRGDDMAAIAEIII